MKHLFLFLFLAQIAFAFPCERFGWFNSCNAVMSSSLSEDEKMTTIASMINDVHQWNTDFAVNEPPESTNVVDDGLVKNAWVRIMAVMPSVYEDDSLLNPGYGEVFAKSNFEINTPSGNEGDDCRTNYDLSHSSQIRQYLNDQPIGKGEVAQFNSKAAVLSFRADFVIDTTLTVDHYVWNEVNDTWECDYDSTETRPGQTVVTDKLAAVRYQPNITYSFNVENKYYGITQIQFNASNYSWFKLQFNNNDFYQENDIEFERFFTLEPYYILNFKPYQHKTIQFSGIHWQNDTFQVTDTSNCKILLGDYFQTYTLPCPLDYKPTDLRITTDKTTYAPGELVTVRISPSNVPVQLSYANVTEVAQGVWQVPAQLSQTVITANYQGVETFKTIHVSDGKNWRTAWSILALFVVSIVLWKIITKSAGGAYDLWNS